MRFVRAALISKTTRTSHSKYLRFISLPAHSPPRVPIATSILPSANKRETVVKSRRRTAPVRQYIFDRTTTAAVGRGRAGVLMKCRWHGAAHTGGNTRRLDGGELIFIAPLGHPRYSDITKFAFMARSPQWRWFLSFLRKKRTSNRESAPESFAARWSALNHSRGAIKSGISEGRFSAPKSILARVGARVDIPIGWERYTNVLK